MDEGVAAPARGNQRHREEVARQAEGAAHAVAHAQIGERLVHDPLAVLGPQTARPAYADIVVAVLGDGRGDDALFHEGFDQQVLRVVSEGSFERGAAFGVSAPQLVADVERGVRPRALRQVLDHLADPLVAVDQEDVALPERAAQQAGVAGEDVLVALPSRGEHACGGCDHLAAQGAHRWRSP